MIKLLEPPTIMASGVSRTIFLSSDPDEKCYRLKDTTTTKTSW